MLKAYNTRLKAKLYDIKKSLANTLLIKDVSSGNFRERFIFCARLLFRKL